MKLLTTILFLIFTIVNSYAADLIGRKLILQQDITLGSDSTQDLGARKVGGNDCVIVFYNWFETPQTIKAGTELVVNDTNEGASREEDDLYLLAQGYSQVFMHIKGDKGNDVREHKIEIALNCMTGSYPLKSLAKMVSTSPKSSIRAYNDYFKFAK